MSLDEAFTIQRSWPHGHVEAVLAMIRKIGLERLWRSLKYEEVYLKANDSVAEARAGIGAWFGFYNDERPHQALGYRTPSEVYSDGQRTGDLMDNAAALTTPSFSN